MKPIHPIRKFISFINELRHYRLDISLGFLMVFLLSLTILLTFFFSLHQVNITKISNKNSLYYNEKLVIVETNEYSSHENYHKSPSTKIFLVRRVSDSTMYAELRSRDEKGFWTLPCHVWYNCHVGDTITFDYIRKDRFFTIKK